MSRKAAANQIGLNHVADYADHQSIETTRGYDEASIELRASFSDMIAELPVDMNTLRHTEPHTANRS
eukprot:SAG11_NODE_2889_length_2863_cov_11.823806_1_plen_67_part_00